MRASIAISALFAGTVGANAASWVRADVYFRGWQSERYAAISPEGLRDEARHGFSRAAHITSPSQLQQLLAVLDLSGFRPVRGDSRSDTYLVIDVFDAAGARTTYRSDSFHVWTADCSRGRAVDAHFRKFFDQFTPRSNHVTKRTTGSRITSMKEELSRNGCVATAALSIMNGTMRAFSLAAPPLGFR